MVQDNTEKTWFVHVAYLKWMTSHYTVRTPSLSSTEPTSMLVLASLLRFLLFHPLPSRWVDILLIAATVST